MYHLYHGENCKIIAALCSHFILSQRERSTSITQELKKQPQRFFFKLHLLHHIVDVLRTVI